MSIDVKLVPFSRYGSYLTLSHLPADQTGPEGVYLRHVGGDALCREVFLLEVLQNGKPVAYKPSGSPAVLRLGAHGGKVELCMPDPGRVRFRGERVGLRLTLVGWGAFDYAIAAGDDRWEINAYQARAKFLLGRHSGHLAVDAPYEPSRCRHVVVTFQPEPGGEGFEGFLELFQSAWSQPAPLDEDFDTVAGRIGSQFDTWQSHLPPAPRSYAPARDLAAYVAWSGVVGRRGQFATPALLQSKASLPGVWAWDGCFAALALAGTDPELAWDQFMRPLRHADAAGALPDPMTDSTCLWGFVKPPLHGWALQRLWRSSDWLGKNHLREVYEPLRNWTQWWLDHRDYDGDGICQYNHAAESGWDDASIFDAGGPVESPDLSALLALQMYVLSELAGELGKKRDEKIWQMRSFEMVNRLIAHSWRGEQFVAPRSGSHETPAGTDCLLTFVPIILGELLPGEVRKALIAGIRQSGRFFLKHGLASESPRSPSYTPSGRWRGAAWPGPSLLIADGLARCGQKGLAGEISRRLCKLCLQHGLAESFDAQSGQPLGDRASTTTACTFLYLAGTFLMKGK